MLGSTFFSIHAISSKLSPVPGSSGIEVLETETFRLQCFLSQTSEFIEFIMPTIFRWFNHLSSYRCLHTNVWMLIFILRFLIAFLQTSNFLPLQIHSTLTWIHFCKKSICYIPIMSSRIHSMNWNSLSAASNSTSSLPNWSQLSSHHSYSRIFCIY